jgi:hypothetical protein
MRQRVAIARTLASEPRILLMDEPFAALDEQTRLLLGDKVLQIQQELKQTTLLITHNLTEAVQLSDRVLVMTYRPGKIKRIVDVGLPHPRDAEVVSSDAFGHTVAQIWSDLREEATAASRTTRRACAREAGLDRRRGAFPRLPAQLCGAASVLAVVAAVEFLIRAGAINAFVIPLPSQVIAAIPRIVVEEHIPRASGRPARKCCGPRCCSPPSASRSACCSTASGSCVSRPRPGSARSPPRRSCSCSRCSS